MGRGGRGRVHGPGRGIVRQDRGRDGDGVVGRGRGKGRGREVNGAALNLWTAWIRPIGF